MPEGEDASGTLAATEEEEEYASSTDAPSLAVRSDRGSGSSRQDRRDGGRNQALVMKKKKGNLLLFQSSPVTFRQPRPRFSDRGAYGAGAGCTLRYAYLP